MLVLPLQHIAKGRCSITATAAAVAAVLQARASSRLLLLLLLLVLQVLLLELRLLHLWVLLYIVHGKLLERARQQEQEDAPVQRNRPCTETAAQQHTAAKYATSAAGQQPNTSLTLNGNMMVATS
jgi:hypothetical protein